ncbi:TPA: hypothetical protein NJ528_001283 [Vibrio parahaemolyticus]|uniref:hypothetical protein n=1 Tax=Vibrio parahaemolyticus TaxID=670 RepID=UPI00111D348F|nr:hypothetical protein [Vibrio parahaemolyticus]EIU6843974.1 hypothetical protein [Vibrio parahaemolyticus]ELB2046768.1 hypothetical protein [Vibrio parahaemolyticus]ELB2186630.1 hypothetical protein [Vibrio parahaemolyticus]ELB2191610.1 hypothetical protein [Vibrio parahaemolyticus]ELB2211210.1 hypothetical protein [Vibrio parahaemolyticus]
MDIKELYEIIFKVSRHFLAQSKKHSIFELKEHNEPTYEQIASSARDLAGVMDMLADIGDWDESRMALNAKQASIHMSEMAEAIEKGCEDTLEIARERLEKLALL